MVHGDVKLGNFLITDELSKLGLLMSAAMRDDPEQRPGLDSLLADLQAVLDEVCRARGHSSRDRARAPRQR